MAEKTRSEFLTMIGRGRLKCPSSVKYGLLYSPSAIHVGHAQATTFNSKGAFAQTEFYANGRSYDLDVFTGPDGSGAVELKGFCVNA